MVFMTNIKKKRCKTVLSLFFTVMLILSAVTFAVSAAEASALSVQLTTDKEEYTADEDVTVTLGIKNTGSAGLVNIAYDITAPDGYELKSGSASGGETELNSGGSLQYDSVYSAIVVSPDNPETGGSIDPVIPLISAVICIAALVAFNRKKAKELLALVLCLSLLSSALPLDVAAEEINSDISRRSADITVTKDITAGGVKKTFTARVTAGETGGNVTVTYDTLGGNKLDSVTLRSGETIGVLPEAVKENSINNGWYFDKDCTKPFYEDEPVTSDITLYAGYDEDTVKQKNYEYSEITINDAQEDYSFSLISSKNITAENLRDVISIENEFGDLPRFEVENTASTIYTVKPVIGWTAGGAYVLKLIDNDVSFTDIQSEMLPDEQIKTITLFIYREETDNVKLKNGIVTVPQSRIREDSDGEHIYISSDEFESLGIDNGTVIFSDNANNSEKSRYVNVVSYEKLGDEYKLAVTSSDIEDIYDELDIYFSEKFVDNDVLAEAIDTEKLIEELYNGEGTQELTYMLAAAVYGSKTVNELGDGSAPFELLSNAYTDGIDPDDNKVKLNVEDLLEGLTISATIGTAKNSNFGCISGFPADHDWTALNITFSYEATLKNKVKLEAEITIDEYFALGVGGAINDKRDFNVKFLPLSQTDVAFKILVCSADEQDDDTEGKKDEKKDISIEIEAIINGDEDGDADNIIKDVQEMLENKGDSIRLCEISLFNATFMPILPLSIKTELNFVVNVSFAAGIGLEASVLQAKGIGIRGNIKKPSTANVYRFTASGDDRYIFDMYAYGYLGVEAGIEGKVSVSLFGLNDLGSVGVGLEIGAYADLYGYLHYHSQDMRLNKYYDSAKLNYSELQGGIYFEMGVYIKISVFAESKLFKKKAELAKQFKIPIFSVGDKYIYADKPTLDGNTDIILKQTDTNVYEIDGLIPAQGTYLDITNGETVTKAMNGDEYKVLCFSRYFKISKNENGKVILTVSPDTPSEYTSGLLSCVLRIYYTGGQNLLFTSDTEQLYYDAVTATYVSRKYIGSINVYYYRTGVEFPLEDIDKTATLTYNVTADGKTVTVDTVTVKKGGYVNGSLLNISNYCSVNGYVYDESMFDKEPQPYYWLTEDTVITLNTYKAQKLYSVEYYDSDNDRWVSELWATDRLDDIKMFDRYKAAKDSMTYFDSFSINRTDGASYQMCMNDTLSYRYYDDSADCTHGLDTSKPLVINYGSEEELSGFEREYQKLYGSAYGLSLKAMYSSKRCIVEICDEKGSADRQYVDYGSEFTVPDHYINNLNNSKQNELVGWDTNGDGKADIEPHGTVTVTGDITLIPVMKRKLYTVTVKLTDSTERKFDVIYGTELPSELSSLIGAPPENPVSDNEDSFYEPSYWLIKSDVFISTEDGLYFAGVQSRYNGDITVMPEGDMYFEAVPAVLYHYITLKANEGGGFKYKDENGEEITADTVRLAVRNGDKFETAFENCGTFAPDDTYTTEYVMPYFTDENGVKFDYGSAVTKPGTYFMKWETNDLRCYINYDVYIYDESGAEVSHKIKASFDGYRPEYDELCKKYDAEIAALADYDDEHYTYTLRSDLINNEYTTAIGRTYKTITVKYDRVPKEFTVTFDYDNGTDVETLTVKYGYEYRTPSDVTKDDKYNTYELVGYDADNDGTADILPGETFIATGDASYTAVWKAAAKLYKITFFAMGGKFEDGSVRKTITGKYGDVISADDIPVPTAPEGYEPNGWDKTVPSAFGNDDGTLETEIKAVYKRKKLTVTYRLVNLDTDTVNESYKTAEYDYGTKLTADMLENAPDTDGCLFGGWLYDGGNGYIGKPIKSDMTLTGTITPVYVIYSLDGVESSREKAKIGAEVTVKEKADGYLAWTTDDATVTDGKFTMPSKNVTFTAEKDLSGYLTISDGKSSTVIDTESKKPISDNAGGFKYDTDTGILTVKANGLKLSGIGKNIMVYIQDTVTDITLENLTLSAGDMNGAIPDDFTSGEIIDERLGTADKYLIFTTSGSLKINISGNVTLTKRNTEVTDDLFAIRQMHLDAMDETPMTLEMIGGENSSLTVSANTYAVSGNGSVSVTNIAFTAAGEYYGVNADTIKLDNSRIKITGLAGTDESVSYGLYAKELSINDCNLDITTGISGETINITGATDGTISSYGDAAATVKCRSEEWTDIASGLMTIALDKGHSVTFAAQAGKSALQAFDFDGGENKIVTYPSSTAADKEFELTKDFFWLIKERNGTALINEITFSGK